MTREDKWKQNYIENLNLQNITWLTLEKDDFLEFINQNYFDEELGEYVIGEDPEIPFGISGSSPITYSPNSSSK